MIKLLIKILVFAGLLVLDHLEQIHLNAYAAHYLLSGLLDLLIFISGLNIILWFSIWLYRWRAKISSFQNNNIIYGLKNIYYIIAFFGFVLIGLRTFGYDIRTVFTSLSIVAAAIAIISKDFLSSVISGIIISFSKVISVNDYVKIGEHKGKIIDIGLVKIALVNEDDDVIYIPNDKVYTSDVINYSKRDINKVSVEFEMNISAIESVTQLEEDIKEALQEYADQIVSNSYNLKIGQLLKDNIKFKFQYILVELNPDIEKQIKRKTVRKVVDFVKSENLDSNKSDSSPISNIPPT